MITLLCILVIIGVFAGIKTACKLISKIILLCLGFVIVTALLSTVYSFLKILVKVALAALCLSIVAGGIKKLLNQ